LNVTIILFIKETISNMDLTQSKLSRAEWETIEVPVTENEKSVLKLICNGFHNVNEKYNKHMSLLSFVKIEKTDEIEQMIYNKYFEETIRKISDKNNDETIKKIVNDNNTSVRSVKALKSADNLRIQNLDKNIKTNTQYIFDFVVLELLCNLIENIYNRNIKYAFNLYTLMQLQKSSIRNINRVLLKVINSVIEYANTFTQPNEVIYNAYSFIERNKYLLEYEDMTLYNHQKEIFSLFKQETYVPKFVLYTAPTGTGKTITPVGLSSKYRVIFVCVARHIGLALAKASISIGKKIAFAFGCASAEDIRLHFYAAIDYTRNKRSGGIGKVDNSVGDNVEIMVCDVQSYLTAMHYMLAFNPAEQIITYWDEPTITLDSEDHALHAVIHRNWVENQIPNMILSCATLPANNELQPVFADFKSKFVDAEVYNVTSYDCRKSIPIIDKQGYYVLPHNLYNTYDELRACAEYCNQNKTILRYFDLQEIIKFVTYVNENKMIDETYYINNYFEGSINEITMNRLKTYYLELLLHIKPDSWSSLYTFSQESKKMKFKTNNATSATNGLLLTTSDAYTVTDGPTIFLTENAYKIGTFYIQQSKIPDHEFQRILENITKNDEVAKKIDVIEHTITALEEKTNTTDNDTKRDTGKTSNEGKMSNETTKLLTEINKLRQKIQLTTLDSKYVPNTKTHLDLWSSNTKNENVFVSNIDTDTAKDIMSLDIDNKLKVLLMLGIGLFVDNLNVKYMEIMKRLADEQRLFIIIADTDYIYGTNYQFCHGMIGKDLTKMTQQKTLQAMGRIGRNNVQQDYTIRFRDDDMIKRLLETPEYNLEAVNMCKLLNTPI